MEGSKKGRTEISNKGYEHRQFKKSRFFEEQRKAKEAVSCSNLQKEEAVSCTNLQKEEAVSYSNLEKMEAEYAEYLRGKYFSGKDIFGEDIFNETTYMNGQIIKFSRICPLKSFADPVAYLKEVAENKKKLTDSRNIEGSSCPQPEVNEQSAEKKFGTPSVQDCDEDMHDSDDESSDSVEELSVEEWNKFQSAMKAAKSKSSELPFKKRR